MEPWKVILMVAAVPTLIAAVLSGMNNATITEKQRESSKQQSNVDAKQRELQETQDKLTAAEAENASVTADTQKVTTELAEAEAVLAEKEVEIQEKTRLVTDAETKIKEFDELVKNVGEINKINELIASEKTNLEQATEEVSRASNQWAIVDAKNQDQVREITVLENEAKNRGLGILPKDVNTSIKQAYNDWGFVIVGAGDVDGLVTGATLDVTRQGKPICKVLITEIEPQQAVADIIPSSLTPGQLVQVGDTVAAKASTPAR